MTGLFRCIPPVIMKTITVSDGLLDQIRDCKIVQSRNSDARISSPQCFYEAVPVSCGSTVTTEPVMRLEPLTLTPVVAKHIVAANQLEVLWFYLNVPVPLFPAVAAVALTAACEIHLGFEGNFSAVARAVVCLHHLWIILFSPHYRLCIRQQSLVPKGTSDLQTYSSLQ